MHWMTWVHEKPAQIFIKASLCRIRAGKQMLAGWLMSKNGYLEAVYTYISSPYAVPVAGPSGLTRLGVVTFAGGMRSSGAARLTGVLHYFTRGPDGIF